MRAYALFTALVILVLSTVNATAAGLSDEEKLGKQLFLTGRAGETVPIATIGAGEVTLPATAVPCASCHGRDGHGRAERGVVPPDITGQALTRPTRPAGAAARARPAYSGALLIRAVTTGIDSSGQALDPVMPRFALSLTAAKALAAWLERLGTLPEPGLDDSALVLGTIAAPGETAVRSVLAAYFDAINRQGGLFGRRLELQVTEPQAENTPGDVTAALAADESIFALIAPIAAGDERAVVAAADGAGMPVIGPLTPQVRAAPRSRYVFYLNGGAEAEGRALASFAATLPGPTRIVEDGAAPWHGAVQAATAALPGGAPQAPPLRPDDAGLRPALAGGGTVLWFADGALARPALAGLAGRKPTLLIPSALAADLLAHGAPAPAYLAFSAGPADVTPDAAAELAGLTGTPSTPPQDRAAQRQTLAAAKILIEALRRAGRDVTRERLVDALEGLQNYHTGLMAPVSFSASRHIGTEGVWIVPFDGGAPVWWDR